MKSFFLKAKAIMNSCKNILLELFWRSKLMMFFVYGGLVLNIVSWIILWRLTKLNQEMIITHYNAYLGIDMMLNSSESLFPDLFLVAIGGIVILLLDLFLAGILLYFSGILDKKGVDNGELDANLLGSKLIVAGGFLVQAAIFIYTTAILFVN